MASVSIENICKSYGSVAVMRDVTVPIANGEFTALVGPSGCGKSTLLRMIAGLEEITAGEIVIDGRVVNTLAPRDRDIAMVFQNYALYPHMSVARNMGFALRLAKIDKAEIDRQVREAARILEIEPLLDRLPKQLSGGQRQRVAMGRAIVRRPKVFLFDEPLSNLDAQLRVQMRSEIKRLHHRLDCTTIYVTHDQIEAMTMADKIVVLRAGRIEQIGAPLELYDRPANLFVAGFIGSPPMNLIRGRFVRVDGATRFAVDNGPTLSLQLPDDLPLDRPAVVGVRPDRLHRVDAGAGTAATVLNVEPTGAETMVSVALGRQTVNFIERQRALAPNLDDSVSIAADPDALHLFLDEDGGRRLN
jgi:multiple sugar transport system ATP-binding protein